jgi:hypothetical protein
MTKPYSIKIFLPGGDPDGLRTIEKSNWSGAGIVLGRHTGGWGEPGFSRKYVTTLLPLS